MIGIICIICLFTIIFGMYLLYKDDNITIHHYEEPKFDKEKAKKEIYNYWKEIYKKQ